MRSFSLFGAVLLAPVVIGVQFASLHKDDSHAFGCTGEGQVAKLAHCGFWGDPHRHCTFDQGCDLGQEMHLQEVFTGRGWHWVARSKDNVFSLQAFFREYEQPPLPNRPASIVALAGKFGSTVFHIMKEDAGGKWWGNWSINGTEVDMDSLPNFWSDGTYMQKHNSRIYQNALDEEDPSGACLENPEHTVSIKAASYEWIVGKYTGYPINFEIEMDSNSADLSFGLCNANYYRDNSSEAMVAKEDILVSAEEQAALCEIVGLTAEECVTPPTSSPAPCPSPRELCEQNGVSYDSVVKICHALQVQSRDMFESCTFDACASPNEKNPDSVEKGAQAFEETVNPQPICEMTAADCNHCNACKYSESVDLTNVVQNNLGGLGPDKGAEEVRYARAVTLSGHVLDLVLTASNYVSPRPYNGENGTFGKLGLAVGTSSDMNIKFVDSDTQESVNLSAKIAFTVYDIDQSKYGAKESIKVCNAHQAYISSDSELKSRAVGNCLVYSSTQHGIGQDNPHNPKDITAAQMARSVTFMFESASSIDFTFSIGDKHPGATGGSQRFVLFSFTPTVACGTRESTDWVDCS